MAFNTKRMKVNQINWILYIFSEQDTLQPMRNEVETTISKIEFIKCVNTFFESNSLRNTSISTEYAPLPTSTVDN